MSWLTETLDACARCEGWAYRPGEKPAAEPTALCALTLVGHDRSDAAIGPLDALATMQRPDGAVAPQAGEGGPFWATAYAVLAWQAAIRKPPEDLSTRDRYAAGVDGGCAFLLSVEGKKIEPEENPDGVRVIGHNTLLAGWPWVQGTHSWLEPTALAYLALKAVGKRMHPRAVEAVALMIDRLLPEGGCNHGNTFILGQTLRPHVLPTGLIMLALGGGETEGDPRVEKSLEYLESEQREATAAASLAYSLLGLTAHGRRPAQADERIERAATQPTLQIGSFGIRRPLLALAALGDRSPLVETAREGMRR
jgi:hypothetical protein